MNRRGLLSWWLFAALAGVTEPGDNPMPTLVSVRPDTFELVADSVAITLIGTGFVWNSLVEWDTIPLPVEADFVSPSELVGMIRSGHTNDGGTHQLRVRNPPPGVGLSAPVTVVVTFPLPRIDSIVPDSAVAGGPGWIGSIWGAGFALDRSQLRADGITINWWTATRTRFDAGIDSAMLASPGTIVLSVTNPPPGGGSATGVLRVVPPALRMN